MRLDIYELIWFKLGMMIATAELQVQFYTSLGNSDFDLRSQRRKKVKTSVVIVSQYFE